MSRSTEEQDRPGRLGRPAGLPKRWSAQRKAEELHDEKRERLSRSRGASTQPVRSYSVRGRPALPTATTGCHLGRCTASRCHAEVVRELTDNLPSVAAGITGFEALKGGFLDMTALGCMDEEVVAPGAHHDHGCFAVLRSRFDAALAHASALPHPRQELVGGLTFDHRVGKGCDVFRIGDVIEYRPELFGGAGAEPAGDLP